MIKLAVGGAVGRMGQAVIQACQGHDQVHLSCAIERAESDRLGMDAGEVAGVGRMHVPIGATLSNADFDVLIEFTAPAATVEHARMCAAMGKCLVIGTTGLTAHEVEEIALVAQDVPVVIAPNMSVGVNLCFHLVDVASRALGDDVDIEILESHHRHKIDAPSGTALRLGEIAASALGRDLEANAVYGRQGQIGPRDRKSIGFSTVRAGDIVGEHTVLFAGDGERVEITHRSSSRMTFAHGALRAAVWCTQRERGLYDMQDVLGLR